VSIPRTKGPSGRMRKTPCYAGTRAKLLQFSVAVGARRWYGFSVLRASRSAMPDGADRREARRFNMTLPMRLLPHDSNSPELPAQTRDVSYRGLYFLAEAHFKLGSSIEFVITLPKQVTRSGDV